MTTPSPENRVKFDKTINLGNLLTMVLVVGAIMSAWSMMDKRVAVLEEARVSQRERDAIQDSTAKDDRQSVKEALNDLRRSVEKVADKVGAQK